MKEEQEEKAGGCQEPEAGFNPLPGCPETSAPARDEQRGFCAGPARERGGGGRRARSPHRTDRPLFPRTKGTAARGGGEEDAGERGAALPGLSGAPRWLSTGLVSHAGLGWGCGMGVWTTASAGREGKRSAGPKANAARGTDGSQTRGVCSAAA